MPFSVPITDRVLGTAQVSGQLPDVITAAVAAADVESGVISEAISAPNDTLSSSPEPKIILPSAVISPVACMLPNTSKLLGIIISPVPLAVS